MLKNSKIGHLEPTNNNQWEVLDFDGAVYTFDSEELAIILSRLIKLDVKLNDIRFKVYE